MWALRFLTEESFCPLQFQLLEATRGLVFKLEGNDFKEDYGDSAFFTVG